MIYQVTDEHGTHFGVFSYKAEYNGQTIYGKTNDEVENRIKELHQNSNIGNEETELPPLVMPIVEPISLTVEQDARFNEYSAIEGITLDDVVNYTFEGKTGTSIAYKLYAQNVETVFQGQMITDLEISEIENGQNLTDLELLMLGGK